MGSFDWRPLIETPNDIECVASILKCFYIMMAQAQVLQLPTMQEFESFNLMEIWHRLKDNEEAIIAWCRLLLTEQDLFARRKYECGHLVREQWILSGYEEETKKGLLVPVPARDQATLLLIIQQWVEPNTTIWTDMSTEFSNLPQLGFAHRTVNHTLNFVASNRRINEQSEGNVAEGQNEVKANVRYNKLTELFAW
eukprot:gene17066-8582_t